MNKTHICPLGTIRKIILRTLAWLFLKNKKSNDWKRNWQDLKTGSQFLATVMGLEIAATAIRSSNFRFTEGQAMGLSLEQFYISSEDRLHQLERIGTWCSWVSMYTVNDHKHVWSQQHFPNLQWKFNPDYFVFSLLMGGVTNQQVSVVSCDSLDPGSSNIYGEPKTSLHQTENGVIILMQLASSQDYAKNITILVTGDIRCAL